MCTLPLTRNLNFLNLKKKSKVPKKKKKKNKNIYVPVGNIQMHMHTCTHMHQHMCTHTLKNRLIINLKPVTETDIQLFIVLGKTKQSISNR